MTAQTTAPSTAFTLQAERPQDDEAVGVLLDHAFGPGRFTKVSERVREVAAFAPELSFCAWEEDQLCGVVRQWRVSVADRPVVFLGPLAVEQDQRCAGVGRLLVERACEAAAAAGETYVLLVGDEAYFRRMGFSADLAREIRMPGPVDPRRVLLRVLRPEAQRLAGPVQA
jgi:predicted N-acetyltransferase YhbS